MNKKMKKVFFAIAAALFAVTALTGCIQPTQASPDAATGAATTAAAAATTSSGSGFNDSSAISVVTREEGSGTRGAFIELLGIQVKGDDGSTKDMTTGEAITADGTNIVMTNVANDMYAIGYISTGSLNDTIKALNVDGAEPSMDNLKSGAYPISRPFNIAYKGEPSGLAADFIGFIFSQEGQGVVSSRGYIAVAENPVYGGSRPTGKLVIDGSSSVFPLMERLVEAYQKINEGAEIEVHMTDSSSGMQAAINGSAEIGMASRELKDAEMAELNHQSIAIDGIAVIVNNGNPLGGLTGEQIRGVFTGEIKSWNELK